VGLLDYYRQFEGLSEEEVNAGKRADARSRRRRALARLPQLDCSLTTCPALPHPDVVNAVTYAARRGLHQYPPDGAPQLRSELAHRHGCEPDQIAIGPGAAALLGAAVRALVRPGQELIIPWPGYSLFPLIARRAGARAVPVAGHEPDTILAAVNERTRAVVIASPNDPTGRLMPAGELTRLLADLPEGVAVLLDEALIDFAAPDVQGAGPALLAAAPQLLVFRSFSKAWGLAGLRCGYALGGPGAEELLAQLQPELGLDELAQVGALESLRSASELVARRAGELAVERDRLAGELRALGLDVPGSQSNFLWLRHPTLDGAEAAAALARAGVIVAPGGALGEPGHMRVTVRDREASERLLAALAGTLPAG
jgi:histidinol-phosphate aminotransferase